MSVNGKNKGSGFERDIARFITTWMSGQSKELYCWRSPGSGSVSTINLGNKAISGDLIPLLPAAVFLFDIFSIECKCGYKGANLFKFLKKCKGNEIRDFWLQAIKQAKDSDKQPLLIFKQTGGPTFIGITNEMCTLLTKKCKIKLNEINSIEIRDKELIPFVLFDMKEFFDLVKPEDIKNL